MKTIERPTDNPTQANRQAAIGNYKRALKAMALANYEYAIELLELACRLHPRFVEYRKELHRAQQYRFAETDASRSRNWIASIPMRSRLQKLMRRARYESVLEYGEKILKLLPEEIEIRITMSNAASKLNWNEVAVELLTEAREIKPCHRKAALALAELLHEQGKKEKAVEVLRRFLRECPEDSQALALLSQYQAKRSVAPIPIPHIDERGLFPPATEIDTKHELQCEVDTKVDLELSQEQVASEALALTSPLSAKQVIDQVAQLSEKQRWYEAKKILEKALRLDPENTLLNQTWIELRLEKKRHDLQETMGKLQELPGNSYLLAKAKKLQDKIAKAEFRFVELRAVSNSTDYASRFCYGKELHGMQRYSEAIAELQAARTHPKHYYEASLLLADCFRQLKLPDLALTNYAETLKTQKYLKTDERKMIILQMALTSAESEDWEKAIDFGNELAHLDYTFNNIGSLLVEWASMQA